MVLSELFEVGPCIPAETVKACAVIGLHMMAEENALRSDTDSSLDLGELEVCAQHVRDGGELPQDPIRGLRRRCTSPPSTTFSVQASFMPCTRDATRRTSVEAPRRPPFATMN